MSDLVGHSGTNQPDIIRIIKSNVRTNIIEFALQPFIIDIARTIRHPIGIAILRALLEVHEYGIIKNILNAGKQQGFGATQLLLLDQSLCLSLYEHANYTVLREWLHITGIEQIILPQSSRIPFFNNQMYKALERNNLTMADINRIKADVSAWKKMYLLIANVSSRIPQSNDVNVLKEKMVALFKWQLSLYFNPNENNEEKKAFAVSWLESLKEIKQLSTEENTIHVQAFQDICKHGEFFYIRFQEFILFLESQLESVNAELAEYFITECGKLDNRRPLQVENPRRNGNLLQNK
jgi:hypothetical protein